MMVTAAMIHRVLHCVGFPIDIKEVCVFIGPLFSVFTVLVTFVFTKELFVRLVFGGGTSKFP